MEEKKMSHGGARSGAGRKPKANARNNVVSLSLSAAALEVLDGLVAKYGTNRNDVVNRLLEAQKV